MHSYFQRIVKISHFIRESDFLFDIIKSEFEDKKLSIHSHKDGLNSNLVFFEVFDINF